jgi:signal-transduction protein with cAMP-binding, CBS, and nucleotidyltransferase domain
MNEPMQVTPTGRAWMLELAEWFEQAAGKTFTMDPATALKVAADLRVVAGDEGLAEELEAWYAAQEEE